MAIALTRDEQLVLGAEARDAPLRSSLGERFSSKWRVRGADSGYRWVDITEGEQEQRYGL
jgi:hypothetical protein